MFRFVRISLIFQKLCTFLHHVPFYQFFRSFEYGDTLKLFRNELNVGQDMSVGNYTKTESLFPL